ncbi:hypothetical protein IJ23_09005 [Vibrio sp. OY15]|nr:hypothetical protein IJ23_09005 [Vibrio sp. OY15]
MTRECKSDFDELIKYISNYKIDGNLDNSSYKTTAKSMHKAYFSLLHWHTEFMHQSEFFEENYSNNKDIVNRISEVVSDVGSSKFNWINGSYKASRVMLRSSIENFVRALGSIDDESLLVEKSVYSLMGRAKVTSIFTSSEKVKSSFGNLHESYKELCKDTHTSQSENMEKISSLVDYPKFYEQKSNSTGGIFTSVVKNILIILCIVFNALYHKMHHKNRENILISIPRTSKPLILAPQAR